MECRLGINAGEVYLIIHFSWVLELLLIDTNHGFPCKLSPEFLLVTRSKLVPSTYSG